MNVQRGSPCLTHLKLGLIRRFTANARYLKQNHYDSLGITPKATQGDIKTAYYKLSKEYHPDLNKGDESAAEKFRNITAAYEILGNVKSRKDYDRGLLIGTYSHEYEREAAPPPDNYPHASFYHGRNKPTSRRTTNVHVQFDIDEWTRAHYSKAFGKKYEKKTEAQFYKAQTSSDERDFQRNLPIVSALFLLAVIVLSIGTDTHRNFDKPSTTHDKPD